MASLKGFPAAWASAMGRITSDPFSTLLPLLLPVPLPLLESPRIARGGELAVLLVTLELSEDPEMVRSLMK